MFESTSLTETISTGSTFSSCKVSHLPYQPAPIKPTRRGLAFWAARAWEAAAAVDATTADDRMKVRRSIKKLSRSKEGSGCGERQLRRCTDGPRRSVRRRDHPWE